MSRVTVNDVELAYDVAGHGPTVVLVHGSWVDRTTWQLVVPALAAHHTVVTYDRRGHSASQRPTAAATRRTEEHDLIALLESLHLGPAHLVGSSYGASIILGVASQRPDLVHSVAAHEPPLLDVAGTDPAVAGIVRHLELVASLLAGGRLAEGASRFVDAVLGTGAWASLPDQIRHTMIANSPTFLAMLDDPEWATPPPPAEPPVPVLLTDGALSRPWLRRTVSALASGPYQRAQRCTIPNAGHAPHLTHPVEYVAVLTRFVAP